MRAWLALSLSACAAPQLDQLLADKHYAEALCAADGADAAVRARVLDRLARDTRVEARLEVVDDAEGAALFGDAAPILASYGVRVVRLRTRTNLLPLDGFDVAAMLEGSLPATPNVLLAMTREPEPPPVLADSLLTRANGLRILGWVFMPYLAVDPTIRDALALRSEKVLVRAPLDDYRRTAPRAMHVVDAVAAAGKCEQRGLAEDGEARLHAGSRCEAVYLVDTLHETDLRARAFVHYRADMMKAGSDARACTMSGESEAPLGRASAVVATVQTRFAGGGYVRLPPPHPGSSTYW